MLPKPCDHTSQSYYFNPGKDRGGIAFQDTSSPSGTTNNRSRARLKHALWRWQTQQCTQHINASQNAPVSRILVLADNVDGSDALGVQAKILGVRLADKDLQPLLNEEPWSPRILLQGARGKALVCHIKEGNVALGDAQVRNFAPLLLGWVNAGWVVCATCSSIRLYSVLRGDPHVNPICTALCSIACQLSESCCGRDCL